MSAMRGRSFLLYDYIMGVEQNPNQQLTPVYFGETLMWIPVTDYYALGSIAMKAIELNDEEPDTIGA